MKFVFGGALSNKAYLYHDALTVNGANFTLGSYFYFKDQPKDYLEIYVTTGDERNCFKDKHK